MVSNTNVKNLIIPTRDVREGNITNNKDKDKEK